MRIGFIGGGVMGEAIIRGILSEGITPSRDIFVSDINTQKCDSLKKKYDISIAQNNQELLNNSDTIILAIKPQTLTEAVSPLKGRLSSRQLVLSIIAGVTIKSLAEELNHDIIVRIMPNTPAQIGEGMSVWTTSKKVSQEQMATTRSILNTLGKEIYVKDEKFLDMATAVSGSGPAYILLIIESFIDAAVHIGFSRDIAKTLVLQTMLGTVKLACESDIHIAELRNMVTSPGGTTAEGLFKLEEGGIRAIISNATIATLEKAKSLGQTK